MFNPEELSEFVVGKLGDYFEISYQGSERKVLFERRESGDILAHVPAEKGPEVGMFNIEAALADPMCGAQYYLGNDEYLINITTRSQVRAVAKIASNHLGWVDEKRLSFRFIKGSARREEP